MTCKIIHCKEPFYIGWIRLRVVFARLHRFIWGKGKIKWKKLLLKLGQNKRRKMGLQIQIKMQSLHRLRTLCGLLPEEMLLGRCPRMGLSQRPQEKNGWNPKRILEMTPWRRSFHLGNKKIHLFFHSQFTRIFWVFTKKSRTVEKFSCWILAENGWLHFTQGNWLSLFFTRNLPETSAFLPGNYVL